MGNATFISDETSTAGFDRSSASASGFSASAYKWTASAGTLHDVISYRGTDLNSSNLPQFNDVWNGWTIGAGFSGASQAALAVKFYDAVLNTDPDGITVTANVELVGHSLGGGLAGFVASHSGGEAYVYDHMPFGLASWAQTIGEALDNAATAKNVSVADAIAEAQFDAFARDFRRDYFEKR